MPLLHDLRRRCRGFLGRYRRDRARPKYDYRSQWTALTRRMSLLPGADEIAREVAERVVLASGATSVAVYLTRAAGYRLSASSGDVRFAPTLDHAPASPSWLGTTGWPAPVPPALGASVTTPALLTAFAVPIRWRTTPLGFIVVGPPRPGPDYTAEDREFLVTVAEQAAAAIAAVRLAEAAPRPRPAETDSRSTMAVIHDIKNSVSALSMLVRNAASNFSDPEFQRDALATLTSTIERMRGSLLKLSPPAAEARSPLTEPIDLQELIVEATTPLATDGKVRLVRRLRPVNAVYGDRDALLRVVENLATNAAEAIDDEGTVTVTLAEEQGHAIISVADTGCGISEDYQERHLFSPFRSTKKGGWGIGLYHTKQVVEGQDGEILVESVEGHGTTFTVRLPLRADVESVSLESV